MKLLWAFALTFGSFAVSLAQSFMKIADLPPALSESSGLETTSEGVLYSINDGGNSAEIFELDTQAMLLRTLKVIGFANVDWEDLAFNEAGDLYIGDIGNNDNKRKDLKIGIVPSTQLGDDSLRPRVINYRYADQEEFPPVASKRNYDCEAMVAKGDSIYLFTKNRTDPFDGWVYVYVLNAFSADQVAIRRDSAFIGSTQLLHWITSAELFENKLLLLSSAGAWIFNAENGLQLGDEYIYIDFDHFSQKEAAAVDDNLNLFVTDEKLFNSAGLFRMNLKQALSVSNYGQAELDLVTKGRGQKLCILSPHYKFVSIAVFDFSGKEIINKEVKGQHEIVLKRSEFEQSMIIMRIKLENGQYVVRKWSWMGE